MTQDETTGTVRTVGLIVNPIAGMGGAVGLRGTDGSARLREAVARGAVPRAGERAERALQRLAELRQPLRLVAGPAEMGESVARRAGLPAEAVRRVSGRTGMRTTAADTRAAAREMRSAGVEVIVFAGGDGTASDICEAIGTAIPVVGIPTGVKMHSGVFARTPTAAGDVVASLLSRAPGEAETERADVVDRAGEAGGISLHGILAIPREPSRILGPKTAASGSDDAIAEACEEIAETMEPGRLYVIGPGTTTSRIREALGFTADPLAVSVVRDRRPVARDVDEAGLFGLVREASPNVAMIMGVIGGQGSLFGRGNQQISARVLEHVPPEQVIIVASRAKLTSMRPGRLSVDTGDPQMDRRLAGYRRVRVARREELVLEVVA